MTLLLSRPQTLACAHYVALERSFIHVKRLSTREERHERPFSNIWSSFIRSMSRESIKREEKEKDRKREEASSSTEITALITSL
jgi:hypothetical protein